MIVLEVPISNKAVTGIGLWYLMGSIFTLSIGISLTDKKVSIARYSSSEDPMAIRFLSDLASSESDSSC